MLPYLHILIRVEDDGSLHAIGAFTSKERLKAYQNAIGLPDDKARLDFYNGPFDEDIKVIYAGHRRWHMDRFQLGGYFKTEGEAWTWVTQEGYVSLLRVNTTYEEEKALQEEALEHYARLQKHWRLASYDDLVAREGADKARATIKLRFYEDALESLKPKTRRDVRALYALFLLILAFPVVAYFVLRQGPDYGENVPAVNWLPDYISNISYYRSNRVQVYEFDVTREDFKRWAESRGMTMDRLAETQVLSRYAAYLPAASEESSKASVTPDQPDTPDQPITPDQLQDWQTTISIRVTEGIIANGDGNETAVYDPSTGKAYVQRLPAQT